LKIVRDVYRRLMTEACQWRRGSRRDIEALAVTRESVVSIGNPRNAGVLRQTDTKANFHLPCAEAFQGSKRIRERDMIREVKLSCLDVGKGIST